ncbi:probable NADH dehydrogenase [ubiquinone] 1 alpha subcomplex subunit 12 [Aethina tumida]|uniref:probable NADH dehydrogenase [ubiquinone] 1 alpha subcomplex subunit 12 n=1 Tax=Aethina tumida TaxID=116153 RepID=UPI002147EB0E|nr:probable NADH dehydrogenase [ubiquinone] 1 alpha subcomplex subunit 12 [Aethina tumida]
MAQWIKFFGLNSFANFFKIVKFHGGVMKATKKMWYMDSVRLGTCVGEDKFGNKYYENKEFFYGRNRWVEYAPYYRFEYDASQIPAEWYGWMHYKTDRLPSEDPSRPCYDWMLEHTENLSGTTAQYMPYSTTRPKISAWVPPKKCS